MRTSIIFGVAVILTMGFASGCGDDDDFGDRMVTKLRSCDLLTAGRVNGFTEPETAEGRCYADCYLGATCDDLEYFMCQTGSVSTATQACLDDCEPPSNDYVCPDGSGTIDEYQVCDGYDDCTDGSDEAACPTFDCADGSGTIPEDYVCDYYDDCYDGSDEVGCAGFDCADGTQTIDPDWVCDYYPQCQDGSDEVGCSGGFDCADGSDTIPPDYVCDFYDDCADGSDEVGCGGFECLDGSYTIPDEYVCDMDEDCNDGSDEDQNCAEPICI